MSLDLSVIICTRLRASTLARTLRALCACQAPPPGRWEVIVVDNGDDEATRQVARRFAECLPVVLANEKRAGKWRALNHGVALARSEQLVFLDDDVLPDSGLLRAYQEAFETCPGVHLFGGCVEWLLPLRYDQDLLKLPAARLVLAHSDFGPLTRLLVLPEMPAGCNMAARRSGLGAALRFAATPQPVRVGLEDTFFFKRVMQAGHAVIYLPQARARHLVRREQLTLAYFAARYADCAVAQEILDDVAACKLILGVPPYLLSAAAAALARLARNCLAVERARRLAAQIEWAAVWRRIRYYNGL